MDYKKIKRLLSTINIILFCMITLPGINPFEFILNIMAPKAAYAIECDPYYIFPISSHDPNDKLLSIGFGTLGYIRIDDTIEYTIRFENDPNALASAQLVKITDPLSSYLDWSTFELGDLEFSNHRIDVPEGLVYYKNMVDLRPEGNNLIVEVEASFNPSTGVAKWVFSAIDPETGEFTEDPLAGFLPPNGDNHEGEGFVKLKIKPKPELPTGTRIENVATIVFDWNPPMDTPLVYNTIDAGTPSSNIIELPSQSKEHFEVAWQGQDDQDGSGIASYDIYISENNGPYELWLKNTSASSAIFQGTGENTYAFYSIAKDNVGNQELAPLDPDTFTETNENHPPSIPTISFPLDMASIDTNTPTLCVQNSVDPDGDTLTYEFEIFSNRDLTPPSITSVNGILEGEAMTSWQCDVLLQEDTWYSWRVRATDGLAYSDWANGSFFIGVKDVSVEMNLPAEWSMISFPVIPDNENTSSLFQNAMVIYSYEKGTGYVRITKEKGLEVGRGYWILLDQNQQYSVTGKPIQQYAYTVYEDEWAMIGGCTSEARPNADNCNIGVVYRYVKGIGYKRVLASEHLEPGQGYWILLNKIVEECVLMVETIEQSL